MHASQFIRKITSTAQQDTNAMHALQQGSSNTHLHVLCHKMLLRKTAMILNRDDKWIGRRLEGVFIDDVNRLSKPNLACQRKAVIYHRLAARPVPAVNLHRAAAFLETARIHLC